MIAGFTTFRVEIYVSHIPSRHPFIRPLFSETVRRFRKVSKMSDEDTLYTNSEAAKICRVSESTLVCWRCAGKGPRFLKMGRAVYYRESAIREWMKAQEIDPASKAA